MLTNNVKDAGSTKQRKVARRACAITIGIAAALTTMTSASAAEEIPTTPTSNATTSDELRGTPFESGANAASLKQLVAGGQVRRSSVDGTLNGDDWRRLRALGLEKTHSAAVVLHFVPKTNTARQVARLRTLARSVELFAPSGACDQITHEGEGRGLCRGSVDGPLGKVSVRMGVMATLSEERKQQPPAVESNNNESPLHLVFGNTRPLEAKPFLSWDRIVKPDHLKVAIDLFPTTSGWFVYTRVAIEMSAHEASAKEIADALLKLDAWLCRDLARS